MFFFLHFIFCNYEKRLSPFQSYSLGLIENDVSSGSINDLNIFLMHQSVIPPISSFFFIACVAFDLISLLTKKNFDVTLIKF